MQPDPTPDLDELERLEKAATPGPWSTYKSLNGWHYATPSGPVEDVHQQPRRNAELIAAARNALPALLDELERARSTASQGAWGLAETLVNEARAERDAARAELAEARTLLSRARCSSLDGPLSHDVGLEVDAFLRRASR